MAAPPGPDVSLIKNAGHSGAVDLEGNPVPVSSLALGPWISLTIANDALNILDKNPRKRSRSSCSFGHVGSQHRQGTRSIPLYNILWVELSANSTHLDIDFADIKPNDEVKAAKLSFPIIFPDHGIGQPNMPLINAFVTTLGLQAYGQAQPQKRAYVLVNSRAGPGGADKKFAQEVRPIFEAARMPLTVINTTHAKHAIDLCRDMDINAHDVVVACSGDGLPHECFNGLAKRPDARHALQNMPVVMIPCGSGNAMACNLYGTNKPSLSALGIVKGVRTPLDLVSITQGNERMISFLSQAFGLVADLDLGTEHLRWMGEKRFVAGFLVKVFQKKQYPCDLAVRVEIESKADVKAHYARLNGGGQPAGAEAEAEEAAAPEVEDDGVSLPPLRYGTVKDKIPGGWERIPLDQLSNFYCGNMAYMAPDANFFPAAMANDGLMDMITVDGDISPLKAIEMQSGVEKGQFFEHPLVKYRKVSAYRIMPRQTTGLISIDGEKVPFEPFQAEVHPSLGLTLSRRGKYEAPGPGDRDSERLLG